MCKHVNVQYSENSKRVAITAYKGMKPVVKVITCKKTGQTIIEVYKEGHSKPIETYIYDETH